MKGMQWECMAVENNIIWSSCETVRYCKKLGQLAQSYDPDNKTNCPHAYGEASTPVRCIYRGSNLPFSCCIPRSFTSPRCKVAVKLEY